MELKVLDKGYVRLVDSMGNDLSIIRSARVSHSKDSVLVTMTEKEIKLLNYLWKHKHTTPFESVTVTFEVKAPIFIFRQWHRHRTQSYNEVSARYTELPDEYYVPSVDVIGEQSNSNKQARIINETSTLKESTRYNEIEAYRAACIDAFRLYHYFLNNDWPRELARMVLPVSTYSRMYTTMNLLNALKFLTLRADSHAQWEIQQYANAMIKCLTTIVPETMKIWELENNA